ncbi:MAG: hypothetical protein GY822_11595 [Deltaproteobacteria bacterium]|nr:hypothetical protein [Deltaproteobacteria bacterium]
MSPLKKIQTSPSASTLMDDSESPASLFNEAADSKMAKSEIAESEMDQSAFAKRSAFLLNQNARRVNDKMVKQLLEVVPHGDLFLSKTLDDAAHFVDVIVARGYGTVYTGGGDGTVVSTLNLLEKAVEKHGKKMPAIGVLKLGTGNAMANTLSAGNPIVDAHHIAAGGECITQRRKWVVCDDGTRAPMAGVGYDGEVLNDYNWLKSKAKNPLSKWAAESVLGYLGAMMGRSIPRHLKQPEPNVRITSTKDAFRIVQGEHGDEEVLIKKGTVLYEGIGPAVCVGTIPYFGFGFHMFPHAKRREEMMQLRIVACGIPTVLTNLYPRIWHGTYRHPKIHDFLVDDIKIEGDRDLPYEIAGDAAGWRKTLQFSVSEEDFPMVHLGERLPMGQGVLPPLAQPSKAA